MTDRREVPAAGDEAWTLWPLGSYGEQTGRRHARTLPAGTRLAVVSNPYQRRSHPRTLMQRFGLAKPPLTYYSDCAMPDGDVCPVITSALVRIPPDAEAKRLFAERGVTA